MKVFFITFLIIAGLFVGYDYYLAPAHEKILFSSDESAPSVEKKADPVKAPTPTTSAPQVTATPTAKPAPTPSGGFQPPTIPTLEEVTKNWTSIPERAFPRPVQIRKAIAIQMSAGSATLAAGTTVSALSAANGQLTVAPTEASPARGQIAVIDTDLPDQISSTYESWKTQRLAIIKANWEAQQQRIKEGRVIDLTKALDPSGKPVQNSDGSYDLLIASVRAGDVTEVNPKTVDRWGSAMQGQYNGQPAWLIDVYYVADTMFGPIPTQARAHIVGGKVVAWIYPGSGDTVD